MTQQPARQCTSAASSTNHPLIAENRSNDLSSASGWRTAGTTPDGRPRMFSVPAHQYRGIVEYRHGFTARLNDHQPVPVPEQVNNTRTLPPDALLECAGRTRWAFGVRQSD